MTFPSELVVQLAGASDHREPRERDHEVDECESARAKPDVHEHVHDT